MILRRLIVLYNIYLLHHLKRLMYMVRILYYFLLYFFMYTKPVKLFCRPFLLSFNCPNSVLKQIFNSLFTSIVGKTS